MKKRSKKEMELKIYNPTEDGFVKEIGWNNEELKKEIAEKVEEYKGLVYTDSQIKEAKADRAKLNKLVKALEDKRKEIKKLCLEPYERFEKQIKEVIAIVNEPIALIDGQVKEYEEQKKKEKQEEIEKLFAEIEKPEWVDLHFLWDTKWLNATKSLSQIKGEIEEKIAKIYADIKTLESLSEFSFEAIETYKNCLDLSRAIAEGKRLAEIQKRKEEAKKEEEERKAEEQARQEEIKPLPFEPDVEEIAKEEAEQFSRKNWIKFEAYMNVEQAKKLRDFCQNIGIEIKPID